MPPARATQTFLDLAYLSRQTFGDAALEADLLRLFARQCEVLPMLMDAGQRRVRADAAHALLGAARAVGALAIAEAAARLETALLHGEAEESAAEVCRAIAATRPVLDGRLSVLSRKAG